MKITAHPLSAGDEPNVMELLNRPEALVAELEEFQDILDPARRTPR